MQTKLIVGSLALAATVAAGGVAAAAGSGHAAAAQPVVKTGHALGHNVLVTRSGRTLYSLSAETNGRFICTNSSCLSLWHPLTVSKGTKPTGAARLGTVRRPDGRTQVTFNHRPLYTFVEDKKPGQAKGEGFKDVGTWHVATTASSTTTKPPATQTTPSYPSY
jgi:predicted lipoprotein with Yx(FWY)xxD motif